MLEVHIREKELSGMFFDCLEINFRIQHVLGTVQGHKRGGIVLILQTVNQVRMTEKTVRRIFTPEDTVEDGFFRDDQFLQLPFIRNAGSRLFYHGQKFIRVQGFQHIAIGSIIHGCLHIVKFFESANDNHAYMGIGFLDFL